MISFSYLDSLIDDIFSAIENYDLSPRPDDLEEYFYSFND
jgi:hypothetical protein